MKICIITANIGTIDEVHPPVTQTMEYELCYYTENTLPFPLPNLDNRMKARYFKTQAHRFLDHDIFIWIDSSIEIINKDFVKIIVEYLKDADIIVSKHKQRESVYEELEYIIDKMKAGDKYLLRRYVKQPLYKEYEFYKKAELPTDFPLYNSFFFAFKKDNQTKLLMNHWWDLILRFSNFDQSQFSFCLWYWMATLKVIETDDLFIRHKHNGYNL
jgi:hypothetical protein